MEAIQDSGTGNTTSPSNKLELEGRSKLPPESHTGPWLVFFHNGCQTFFSISEGSFYVRSIDDMRTRDCWPTAQGWVLMKEQKSRQCVLLNPASLEKFELPPLEWSLDRKCKCVLSSQPDGPNNSVVLIADFSGSCMYFCWPRDSTGKQHWKRLNCRRQCPLRDVVALNGTFYAYIDARFAMIRFLPDLRLVFFEDFLSYPRVGLNYHSSKVFMLESCGDIFLVRCFLERPTSFGKKVTHVEVDRRNSTIRTWNGVDNVGGRVFFLDVDRGFAASWSATELGVKGNCMYITTEDDKHMYVFDMEEGTVCVRLPCPNLCSQPFWMMPPVSV